MKLDSQSYNITTGRTSCNVPTAELKDSWKIQRDEIDKMNKPKNNNKVNVIIKISQEENGTKNMYKRNVMDVYEGGKVRLQEQRPSRTQLGWLAARPGRLLFASAGGPQWPMNDDEG